MDIATACKTVHEWADIYSPDGKQRPTPPSLIEAVSLIKAYLEREKADGKPIKELEIAPNLLCTREGVRWVMPFAMSAESMEATKRRKAAS